MPYKMELRLWHDGKVWLAENEQLHVAAKELFELDQQVLEKVKALNLYASPAKVEVFMRFDQTVIPEWIRQYANHYFNRSLILKI